MEQLLFLLFLLFSVGSALLERRKRAKALEEAQKRADERRQRGSMDGESAPVFEAEEEEEDEQWGGWPMPGGDPFEQPRPQTAPVRPERSATPAPLSAAPDERNVVEVPAPVADVRSLLEQMEQQSYRAEQRAREEEARAMRRAQEARRVASVRQPIGELIRQRQQQVAARQSTDSRRRVSSWRLTPKTARRAVVLAEILGSCKAERDDANERWLK